MPALSSSGRFSTSFFLRSEDAISIIGHAADYMLDDDGLRNIRRAKIFKWLAACAPHHIPMLDSLLYEALSNGGDIGSAEAICRFRNLLLPNIKLLERLGKKLHRKLSPRLSAPVPPVRILDSLIWFDWWVCTDYYDGRFRD